MEEGYLLKKPVTIKKRKRIGRGMSSGNGKTSGRGQKGQYSRTGSKSRPWFEGGQMPIQRRVPKRGFNNIFKINYNIVNLSAISKVDADKIDHELLNSKGLLKNECNPVKILGFGEISKAVEITADAFSSSAKEKIEKAGGKAIVGKYINKNKEKVE